MLQQLHVPTFSQLSLNVVTMFLQLSSMTYQVLILTLLKITRLAIMKSYLVIIGPNSHERLTKVKLGKVGSCMALKHSSSLLEVISG